jgi:hypothetical protein
MDEPEAVGVGLDLDGERRHVSGAPRGHEARRMLVDLDGWPDLDDASGVEDDEAVGECHRLDGVVRGEHRRHPIALLERTQLESHPMGENRVEVGQRLVEEQQRRQLHQCPRHLDELRLARRQVARRPREQRLDVQGAGLGGDPRCDLVGSLVADLEREGDVVVHIEMGEQHRRLEHHRDAAFGRRSSADVDTVDPDRAARRLIEAGDHAQQRRLAGTRRTDHADQLAIGDLEADVVERRDTRTLHGDVFELDDRHR